MVSWFRTFAFVPTMFIFTIGVSMVLIAVTRTKPKPGSVDRLLRFWSRTWFKLGNVQFSIDGHTIDPTRSYVIVSNHQSNFDIMANFLAVPVEGRFIAKAELFRIPFLSGAMRAIGIIKVDRSKPSASLHHQLNTEATANLSSSRSLIVYPEGTRSITGELGTFKRGAFRIAINEQLPILPITIAGSGSAWPPQGRVSGGPILVRVAPPIETAGMAQSDLQTLVDTSRTVIETDLTDLNRQLQQAS